MTDKKKLQLYLLRAGAVSTGGARHESFFAEELCRQLIRQGLPCTFKAFFTKRIYRGYQNIKLLRWGFRNSKGDVNIIVDRIALPAIIRNLKSRRILLLVLHHVDNDFKRDKLMSVYISTLFTFIKFIKPKRLAIITVSPYYKDYFLHRLPKIPIFLVPNFFNIAIYRSFIKPLRRRNKIYLGQFSAKNHPSVFQLANALTQKGYSCFFTTLYSGIAGEFADYGIKHLDFESYLQEMAEAYCTVSFTAINEGWSRVSHESILVGTPVIGFDRGGLGNLLHESNAYIVNSAEEALEIICGQNELRVNASEEFISKYDTSNSNDYLIPIAEFIKANTI